jgi:hypothetical protein
MTQTSAEILILVANALGAGILMFITGVVQKIMNTMDEADFKRFLNALDTAAMRDPFAVTVATIPVIAAVPYLIFYGFQHWWFIAGLFVWAVGSSLTKVINLPVYRWVGDPSHTDPEGLREQRRKLQLGNTLRAWSTLVSVVLMTLQFGIRPAVVGIVLFVVVAVPLTWYSSRYKLA